MYRELTHGLTMTTTLKGSLSRASLPSPFQNSVVGFRKVYVIRRRTFYLESLFLCVNMARARNIKPSLFKNELLGVADPLLTILFTGLWCLADREGRLEDRPLRIKAEIFPYREIDVPLFNGYLTELSRLGFIDRYNADGVAVIQVINFVKHQSPHNTEKASELPAKSLQTNGIQEITVKQPLSNGEVTAQERSDSLIPDSLIPDSLNLIADVTTQSKSDKKKEKERPLSEQKKATRLPNDFIATEELLAWAKVKRPTIDPSLETEKFINYWTAKSGKDATKLDWNATWRNWILNAKESSNGSYYQQREQTVINERNAINQLREAVKEISGDDAHHSPRQLLGFSENGYNG